MNKTMKIQNTRLLERRTFKGMLRCFKWRWIKFFSSKTTEIICPNQRKRIATPVRFWKFWDDLRRVQNLIQQRKYPKGEADRADYQPTKTEGWNIIKKCISPLYMCLFFSSISMDSEKTLMLSFFLFLFFNLWKIQCYVFLPLLCFYPW